MSAHNTNSNENSQEKYLDPLLANLPKEDLNLNTGQLKKKYWKKVINLLNDPRNEFLKSQIELKKFVSRGSTPGYWFDKYIEVNKEILHYSYANNAFEILSDPILKNQYHQDVREIDEFLATTNTEGAGYDVNIPDANYAAAIIKSITYPPESEKKVKIISYNRVHRGGDRINVKILNLNYLEDLRKYLGQEEEIYDENYKDSIDDILSAYRLRFEIVLPTNRTRQRRRAGFFKFWHNLDGIDLKNLQIFQKPDLDQKEDEQEIDRGQINCLIHTLKVLNFNENQLNLISKFVVNGTVSKNKLEDVAKLLDIGIDLEEYVPNNSKKNFNSQKYNKKCETRVQIGFIESHYFPILEHEITPFSLKNYQEVKNEKEWWKIAQKRSTGTFKRRSGITIKSHNLVRILVENREKLLTQIPTEYLMKYSIKDYSDELIEPEEENPNSPFTEVEFKENHTEWSEIYAFDTEATPHGKHTDFCGSLVRLDPINNTTEVITTISGKNYLEAIFTKIPGNKIKQHMKKIAQRKLKVSSRKRVNKKDSKRVEYIPHLIYIHNLKYDFSFLKKYSSGKVDMIKNGGRILQVSGTFFGKKIVFRDSLSVITAPLSKFGKMFKLEQSKDICPYTAYTKKSIKQKQLSVKVAERHLETDSDRQQFRANLEKYNLYNKTRNYFNHLKYCEIYCELDTNILAQGLLTFRKWMLEVTELDIFDYITLPSISHAYFSKSGCYEGVYYLHGITRDYHQKAVVGGRCQLSENQKVIVENPIELPEGTQITSEIEKLLYKNLIQDFDACSLYPSAMYRIGLLGGYLKGKPIPFNNKKIGKFDNEFNTKIIAQADLDKVDGYFVKINIKKMPISRPFPVISKVFDNKRNWINTITGELVVDNYTLEDLQEFHGMKEGEDYEILEGYIYNSGKNNKIFEVINTLYNTRKQKKKEGNPIESVYKLLMNAAYGKTIQKPIKKQIKLVHSTEELNNLIRVDHNRFIECEKIIGTDKYWVVFGQETYKHKSTPQIGAQILSMSKRVMNEVQQTAHTHHLKIYYQDTDSVHMMGKDVDKLEEIFYKKYGRELIGKDMGQFHCDFDDYKGKKALGSVKFIGCGKKIYYDKIAYNIDGKIEYHEHTRMKGVKNKVIEKTAKKLDETVEKIYENLYKGSEYRFDLAGFQDDFVPCFEFSKDFTVKSCEEFVRTIKV